MTPSASPRSPDPLGVPRQIPLPLIFPPADSAPVASTTDVIAALSAADDPAHILPLPPTPSEERRLAWNSFLGRQAQARLESESRLPPATRRRLRRIVGWGRTAQERLIVSNLRLVVHWAKRLTPRCASILACDDLIQSGAIGLMIAVERFDPRRRTRFSTYAVHWVLQSMQRAFGDAYIMSLPTYLAEEWRYIAAALDESDGDMERAATIAAQRIAARGTSTAHKRAKSITPDTMRAAVRTRGAPVSLDALVSADPDASPRIDLIADPDASPDDVAVRRIIVAQVRRLVDALPEAERAAVQLRFFPPDGSAPLDQKQRAAALGVSVHRLRVLERSALARLQTAAAALDLHEAISA